ncbi:MAG: helix-turn-helix domain-containing protein [Leptolyngbyaceae cyanobacterium RU_5_1]|nr:helix-turn-helix domain-containing protein [Leptolyngbyaceae cyanobacterium RU_5_1]
MQVTLTVEIPHLGTRLKQARDASGKTPAQIAVLADMSVANLYRIESEDTKSVPGETLKRLDEALGTDFYSEVKAALLSEIRDASGG